MPNINSESLDWLDNLAAITAQLEKTPDATHAELGKALNIDRGKVTVLLAIKPCLDPAAIEKIQQAAKTNPPYTLSFNSARALAGLKKKKVADLQGSVHMALDVVLAQRLATKDIKNLVEWMAADNSPESFDPKAKPHPIANKALGQPNLAPQLVASVQVKTEPEEEVDENTQPTKPKRQKNETLGQKIGSGIDQFFGLSAGNQGSSQSPAPEAGGNKKRSQKKQKGNRALGRFFKKLGEKFSKIAWKELFKIEHRVCRKLAHAIVPLHTHSTGSGRAHSSRRHKSGSLRQGFITLFLTPLHWAVYVLLQYAFLLMVTTVLICPFVPALKPFLEWPLRLAAHFAVYDFPAWVWACAQSHLGPTLIVGGLLAAGLYFAWKAEPLRISLLSAALAYLIVQGRGWSTNADTALVQPSLAPRLDGSAQVPPPVPVTKTESIVSKIVSHTSPEPKKIYTPVSVYQPAVSFNIASSPSAPVQTIYDPKILELEIKSLPGNYVMLKDFPVTPDEGMPFDVAVSRMQDSADPDKYTMMIGGAKQIISSVNPTSTTLTIQYKSADPFNVFGGGNGLMNFLWEDVKYIHTNEIDILLPNKPAQIIYQCSLVVSGSKYPLTIQCATADDLEHLVSTMQYFIRHSRLGHDTALAGMPYPDQGIRFNNDRVITLLWANSPMDRGGVNLGDHPWSVGKITSEQQSRKELETGLSSLPVTLFTASPAEWDKALQISRQPGSANFIHPTLRKVILTTP